MSEPKKAVYLIVGIIGVALLGVAGLGAGRAQAIYRNEEWEGLEEQGSGLADEEDKTLTRCDEWVYEDGLRRCINDGQENDFEEADDTAADGVIVELEDWQVTLMVVMIILSAAVPLGLAIFFVWISRKYKTSAAGEEDSAAGEDEVLLSEGAEDTGAEVVEEEP